MKYKKLALLNTLLAIFAVSAWQSSAEIISEGILGNSGEHGDSLVKTSGKGNPRDIFGMVFDRFGTIWASAGAGRINRYSLDGRKLASFSAPKSNHRSRMTLVGDNIVMVGERESKLFVLDIKSEPGTNPEYINIKGAVVISFGSKDGKMLYATDDNKLFSLDVATRESKLLGALGEGRCDGLEILPDGSIFVSMGRKMGKFANGKLEMIRDAKTPGGYLQYIDGFWYGHVWHGTIRKYQKNFESVPGVVYGGGSGSFIGKVRCNEELSHGHALYKIEPNLFATSGIGDIVFILEWNEDKQQFSEVRRIGALSWHNNGIVMNDEGDILVRNGRWHWRDKPDTPFYETTGFRIGGQLAIAPDNTIVGPGYVYETSIAWVRGKMNDVGAVAQRWIKKVELRKDITGTVAFYGKNKKRCVLTINKKGEAVLHFVDGKWTPEKEQKVELKIFQPIKEWNNLGMLDNEHLIASADGQIIEFAADGDNWKEVKRWNKWGEKSDQKFGNKLYISLHNNLLWVADTDRHRVLCFDRKSNKFLGQFGKTDKPGTGLDELDGPTGISSRGLKAALIDGNNERVIKLSLKK